MSGNGIIDFVEDAMGTIERISNVAKAATGRPGSATRRSPPARQPIRTRPAETGRQTSGAGHVRVSEFSIVETIDAYTGKPEFIVRNGRGDVASCSSMAFAQRVRDSLG